MSIHLFVGSNPEQNGKPPLPSPIVYGLGGEFNDALVDLVSRPTPSPILASHRSVGREIVRGRKRDEKRLSRDPSSFASSYPFLEPGWKGSREEEEEGLSLTRVYSFPEMELDF